MEYDRNQWCTSGANFPPPQNHHYQNGYETQNGFLTALQGDYPAPSTAPTAPPPCYPSDQFEQNGQMINMNGYYHQRNPDFTRGVLAAKSYLIIYNL